MCSLSLKCVWWSSGPSLAENTPFSWIIFPRNRSIATFDCRRGTSLYIPWIFHYTTIKPPFVLLNHPLLWVAKNIDAFFPTGWLINREQYCIQLPFPFIFQYIPIIIPLYPHQATFLAIVQSRYITIFTRGSPSSSIWTEPHVGQPAQPVTLGPSGWRFSLDLHVPGQERHLRVVSTKFGPRWRWIYWKMLEHMWFHRVVSEVSFNSTKVWMKQSSN